MKQLPTQLFALLLLAGLVGSSPTAQSAVLGERKTSSWEGPLEDELADGDRFGSAVASLGDLDDDGIGDLAVGAPGTEDSEGHRGALWILYLNADGSARDARKLGGETTGFGVLADGDRFGAALASLEDLDGDGLRELVVGSPGHDQAGFDAGAIWVVFPDAEGGVKKRTMITAGMGGLPPKALREEDAFGSSLARIGDLDGDGIPELAVGTPGIDDQKEDTGGVWVLYLTSEGTVRRSVKLSASSGRLGFIQKRRDRFGTALGALGDLNGDGVPDLAVGAPESDDGAASSGAVWILFLRRDGLVGGKRKISATGKLRALLDRNDLFGSALATPGDLNGDGVPELLVGAPSDDDGAQSAGAVWVVSLNRNGRALEMSKITSGQNGFTGPLHALDQFGSSLAVVGDLDGLARPEVVVGSPGDDEGGGFSLTGRGAIWTLFLDDGTYPHAEVRNGTGINELVYSHTNLPFVGQTWLAEIDASHHENATLTIILAYDKSHAGFQTRFGELLVSVRGLGGRQVFRSIADSGGGIAVHANPIPDDLALAGHEAHTQGVILGGGIELVNALDLRVGY